jgi:chemotaxis protein CheZ
MMNVHPPSVLTEDDYDTIEAAVMETARGRWFLSQYAQRNRSSDTRAVLDAIGKLESIVQVTRSGPQEQVRYELMDMSAVIERTKRDIAQLTNEAGAIAQFANGGEDLENVVSAGQQATQQIIVAAEKVQEVAWTLRDQGADANECDVLDQKTMDIYLACSVQDVSNQGIAKVIQTLRHLDGRINAMMDLLNQPTIVGASASQASAPVAPAPTETSLLARPVSKAQAIQTAPIETLVDEDLFVPVERPTPQPQGRHWPSVASPSQNAPAPEIDPAQARHQPVASSPPSDQQTPRSARPPAQNAALQNVSRQDMPSVARNDHAAPTPASAPRQPIHVSPQAITAIPDEAPRSAPLASRRSVPLLPDLADLSFAEKMALFS